MPLISSFIFDEKKKERETFETEFFALESSIDLSVQVKTEVANTQRMRVKYSNRRIVSTVFSFKYSLCLSLSFVYMHGSESSSCSLKEEYHPNTHPSTHTHTQRRIMVNSTYHLPFSKVSSSNLHIEWRKTRGMLARSFLWCGSTEKQSWIREEKQRRERKGRKEKESYSFVLVELLAPERRDAMRRNEGVQAPEVPWAQKTHAFPLGLPIFTAIKAFPINLVPETNAKRHNTSSFPR